MYELYYKLIIDTLTGGTGTYLKRYCQRLPPSVLCAFIIELYSSLDAWFRIVSTINIVPIPISFPYGRHILSVYDLGIDI